MIIFDFAFFFFFFLGHHLVGIWCLFLLVNIVIVFREMVPKQSENGVEGDDEREEEEEEEDSEEEGVGEEEEDEEEEEPRLKYQRMGGSVPSLLASDAASCIAVAERMIALGTHGGAVHILDFLGNQVNFFYFLEKS